MATMTATRRMSTATADKLTELVETALTPTERLALVTELAAAIKADTAEEEAKAAELSAARSAY